jgi:hypothetical protein
MGAGKMFLKKGNHLPRNSNHGQAYAEAIAEALRTELGGSHRATKTLMRWTGASDRTAKNWLSGCCGPSGDHLVRLAKESDTVLATILGLADRNQHMVGADLLAIRQTLLEVVQLIDGLFEVQEMGVQQSLR